MKVNNVVKIHYMASRMSTPDYSTDHTNHMVAVTWSCGVMYLATTSVFETLILQGRNKKKTSTICNSTLNTDFISSTAMKSASR